MVGRRLETEEEIFRFLLALEPKGREYEPVKKFIASAIYNDIIKPYRSVKYLPAEYKNIEQVVIDYLDEFSKKSNNQCFEIESKLLEYGERIVNAEKLFSEGHISSCLELLNQINADAKSDQVEDYVLGYVKQIRDKIDNHEYVIVESGRVSINKNFILYDIQCELVDRTMPREQVKEIAERVYANIEKSIEEMVRVVGSNLERIKIINKSIHENIKKVPQELLDYYSLKIYFEQFCTNDMPFTDEEARNLEVKFNRLKKLFEAVKDKLVEGERSDGAKTLDRINEKLKRPYGFISVVEEDGRLYAIVSGDVARAEFLEYVKTKILEKGYDEECANIALRDVLRGEISCPLPWKNVDAMINDIIEKTTAIADLESTKKYSYLLIEKSKTCSGIDEGLLLAHDMEYLLVKMQNSIYSQLAEDFKNVYASYLMLIRKTMDRIEESNLPPEQKYTALKELSTCLHRFGDGEYEDVEGRLNNLRILFAKNMFEPIGETKIIKNKMRFWSGVGIEVAGLTVFGLGLAFLPWIAPFGIAVLPAGMKLIKDGVSELKEKHDEFVRGKAGASGGSKEQKASVV